MKKRIFIYLLSIISLATAGAAHAQDDQTLWTFNIENVRLERLHGDVTNAYVDCVLRSGLNGAGAQVARGATEVPFDTNTRSFNGPVTVEVRRSGLFRNSRPEGAASVRCALALTCRGMNVSAGIDSPAAEETECTASAQGARNYTYREQNINQGQQ